MNDQAAPVGVDVERRFNHDLLVDEVDREIVARRWPRIARFLVNPVLRDHFLHHEKLAKEGKRWVQYVGTTSVLLMLFSLGGMTLQLVPSVPWGGSQGAWHTAFEIAGVAGIALAVAVWHWRKRWLRNRFMTEVLRQWHFRWLMKGVDTDDVDARIAQRDQELMGLLHGLSGAVSQRMDSLMETAADPLSAVPEPKLPRDPAARAELLEAYEQLRLRHQLEFAIYKLSDSDRTFLGLSNSILVRFTRFAAALTLLAALVLAALPLFRVDADLVHVALLAVIVGVAVRAWRDGLSLGEERERYQEVRHRLELLDAFWKSRPDDASKFALSRELEQAALRELRNFLREHDRAQFLI